MTAAPDAEHLGLLRDPLHKHFHRRPKSVRPISRITQLADGTVYGILPRLEERGWT